MHPALIYTLFPRLAGTMPQWLDHSARAASMGFNWIHLNPFHPTGASGSLYAVSDFFSVNPTFVPPGCDDPLDELRKTVAAMHDQGLRVMVDLVINHTAKDAPLVGAKPRWFRHDHHGHVVSPFAIDPGAPGKITVWEDLAEVANADSSDRHELWAYWTKLVQFYLDLGVDGFRADAAYKVPLRLWQQLIGAARNHGPQVVFAAETLGCRLDEVRALGPAGFDYLFNSSKWWHFDQPWALKQHEEFGTIAPSVSFPESHDTERLFAACGRRLHVQKQRYAVAAAFSAGLLMPIGYEYAFERPLHVVRTTPADWEPIRHDLTGFITEVNRIKQQTPVLSVEGHWDVVTNLDGPTTVMRKRGRACASLYLLINKDWHNAQRVATPRLEGKLVSPQAVWVCRDPVRREDLEPGARLELQPAEVVFVVERAG